MHKHLTEDSLLGRWLSLNGVDLKTVPDIGYVHVGTDTIEYEAYLISHSGEILSDSLGKPITEIREVDRVEDIGDIA